MPAMSKPRNVLLARYAESLFWMGRYVERAENLARIMDVTETFSRDSQGAQNWYSVVQINADEERFSESYGEASAQAVRRFYMLDAANPTSILASVRAARECARALRPLISTEMWMQLNVFYNAVSEMRAPDIASSRLSRTCSFVKEACQTHVGITEGTFYRDQGWYFLQLGRHLERADQTTRLLDIKYHLLLPAIAEVNSALDTGQWNALLRAAAGYHAFRRVFPRGMTPDAVAGFLLLNEFFPRSVALCVDRADSLLTELRSRHRLRGGSGALEILDEVRATLASRSIESIIAGGLHEFIDALQISLTHISNDVAASFFDSARG